MIYKTLHRNQNIKHLLYILQVIRIIYFIHEQSSIRKKHYNSYKETTMDIC